MCLISTPILCIPCIGAGTNLTFKNLTETLYQGVGVDLRVVGSINDTTWGLDFTIMEEEEKLANVFLYHDLFDENFEEDVDMLPNINLWITCLKEENPEIDYIEKPWNGTWKSLETNDMRFVVTIKKKKKKHHSLHCLLPI